MSDSDDLDDPLYELAGLPESRLSIRFRHRIQILAGYGALFVRFELEHPLWMITLGGDVARVDGGDPGDEDLPTTFR